MSRLERQFPTFELLRRIDEREHFELTHLSHFDLEEHSLRADAKARQSVIVCRHVGIRWSKVMDAVRRIGIDAKVE